ncbi:MAG: hypothetical protein JW993_16500 [Sedimentisphaerales bacterium]|nr:hypothetical protein [Sedimentisphaerales bacterium]
MMPGNLFCLELAAAFADRRRLALRVGLSVLLALPFILIDMPAQAQAAGVAMVILFTGLFGAAVGHARLREDRRYERLALLPTARGTRWLDLVLASTLSRLAPTVVVLTTFVIIDGRGTAAAPLLLLSAMLCGSLLLLTLLGMLTARLAHSNAEVHLFGALAGGLLAFLSGLTPLPARMAWLAGPMNWNPLSQLHQTLVACATGSARASGPGLAFAALLLAGIATTAVVRWTQGTGSSARRN